MSPGGYEPFTHAEQLGIKVVYRELENCNGLWVSELNVIYLSPGMRRIHERCVLAHEIGHAVLGHRDSSPKNELQADIYAAKNLITPRLLLIASRLYDHDRFIAEECGVTVPILKAYRKAIEIKETVAAHVGMNS